MVPSAKNGRFETTVTPPVGRWDESTGRCVLRLAGDVILTQKDVRQVQLAKAAIRAGLDALLAEAKVRTQDVGRVLVAGSFGYHLRPDSLAGSGPLASAAGCQSGGRGQHMQGRRGPLCQQRRHTSRNLQAVGRAGAQHRAGQRCGLWSAVSSSRWHSETPEHDQSRKEESPHEIPSQESVRTRALTASRSTATAATRRRRTSA